MALVFAVFGGVVALVAGLVVATFVLHDSRHHGCCATCAWMVNCARVAYRRAASDGWIAPRMNQVAVFELQGVMSFGVAAHLAEQVRLLLQPRHPLGRAGRQPRARLGQHRAGATARPGARPAATGHRRGGGRARWDRQRRWAVRCAALPTWTARWNGPRRPSWRSAHNTCVCAIPTATRSRSARACRHRRARRWKAVLRPQLVPSHSIVFAAGDTDRDLLIVQSAHHPGDPLPAAGGLRLATVGRAWRSGRWHFSAARRTACAGTEHGVSAPDCAWPEPISMPGQQRPQAALTVMNNLAPDRHPPSAATLRAVARGVVE